MRSDKKLLLKARKRLVEAEPAVLGEGSARQALAPLDLPFSEQIVVDSPPAAIEAWETIGPSVVLKVLSDQVPHKSEAGLVLVGLNSVSDVLSGFSTLSARAEAADVRDAVIAVQAMAPPGLELFVGIDRDLSFGPLVIVGFGGTAVELHRDVAHRLTPVGVSDVHDMVSSLRQYPVLAGFRGGPVYELAPFVDLVVTMAAFADVAPELAELDLNPVRLYPDGSVVILDARLVASASPSPTIAPSIERRDLTPLFHPASIAVVGASRNKRRPGGRVVSYLTKHGYQGAIYPVNQNAGTILDLPAYPSLAALPEVPDLVCIALPPEATVKAVREAADLGACAVVAFASGFREIGTEGEKIERELRDVLTPELLLCGPNTMGVVSSHDGVTATFSQALEVPVLTPGPVALISQSGAVGGSLVSRELIAGYGLSHWVTVGNETQLGVEDYLEYLVTEPEGRVVAIFLEGVRDGRRFRAALDEAAAAAVPVVAFKTGKTTEGAAAVTSHSAVLAGHAQIYATALAQAGAVEVEELTSLLEVAYVLSGPKPRSANVAIIATSGGAASATVDLAVRQGLKIPQLTPQTRATLHRTLPPVARPDNPLDVTAEGAFKAGVLREVVEVTAKDGQVGAICVVLTSLANDDALRVGEEIADAAMNCELPVLVTWLLDASLTAAGRERLVAAGVRVFDDPGRMVSALGHLNRYAGLRGRETVDDVDTG